MDLNCPRCHKHRFTARNFLMSRMGGNEYPVICPHCGAMFSLDKKAGNIVNLVSFAAFFGYIGLMIALFSPITGWSELLMAIIGLAVLSGVRAFAISRFGKMTPYEVKREHEYPKIKLSQVRGELDGLKKDKDFFVLFAPDESAYISFGLKHGVIVADLAFAIGKFEELEPAFRAAVGKVGAKAKAYKKRQMSGVEADLGSDLDAVATKSQTIMREVFHLGADAEVPVIRQD